MSRSSGPGYPISFRCTRLARTWPRTRHDHDAHHHTLTGRTRDTARNGKGHPRKSWITFEWSCTCGASGWSSHADLERIAIREGIIATDDPRRSRLGRPLPEA